MIQMQKATAANPSCKMTTADKGLISPPNIYFVMTVQTLGHLYIVISFPLSLSTEYFFSCPYPIFIMKKYWQFLCIKIVNIFNSGKDGMVDPEVGISGCRASSIWLNDWGVWIWQWLNLLSSSQLDLMMMMTMMVMVMMVMMLVMVMMVVLATIVLKDKRQGTTGGDGWWWRTGSECCWLVNLSYITFVTTSSSLSLSLSLSLYLSLSSSLSLALFPPARQFDKKVTECWGQLTKWEIQHDHHDHTFGCILLKMVSAQIWP